MSVGCGGCIYDIKLLDFTAHDRIYVERDGSLYWLPKRRGADFPLRGEPAGRTLHSHSEFRQTSAISRQLGRAERARVVANGDARAVIPDLDANLIRALDLNLDLEAEIHPVKLLELLLILQVALERVINK